MSIDDIILYVGIASGVGILAMLLPSYFRKLLNGDPSSQPKSLIRN